MNHWLFLAILIGTTSAWSGTIYEWRDPATGQLRLGEKPPPGAAYWKPGNESLGDSTKKNLDEVVKQTEQIKAAQSNPPSSLYTCTMPSGQIIQQATPCESSTKTSKSATGDNPIFGVLGVILVLGFLVSLFGSRKCTVCGTRIKKKYFTWKVNGEKEVMCPKCNSRMESRVSRQAFNRKFR